MSQDLVHLPAWRLAELIRTGELTSSSVVEAHLQRIEAVNPQLSAVVALRMEAAMADARRADESLGRGDAVGPLHGVPFTAKDWLETNDLPTAAGYEQRRNYMAKQDATAVARLRAAGAILLGKTKTGTDPDIFPRTNNPHDCSRTPGGSSAGEAALIAAGGSPIGLGSDSGGSLRWPAHCCGVATLKPTTGRVPLTGHFPRITAMVDPRTAIGPMARTVADLTLALPIISGPDGHDPSVMPVPLRLDPPEMAGLRIAFYTAMPGASPTLETVAAVESSARALAARGAVVTAATPPRLGESLGITQAYWSRTSSLSASEWRPYRPSPLSGNEIEKSLFEWDRFRRSMFEFMHGFDAIICPVAEGPAPLHEAPIDGQTYLYTLPSSLTGYPVAVVRAGTSPEGLPIGIQVVAGPWREDVALAVAAAIETNTGGWQPPSLRSPGSPPPGHRGWL